MGAPNIKAKKDRNYRKGRTGRRCSTCDHFVYNAQGPEDHRCRIVGLDGGRSYRILSHYLCDDYDNSESIQRLKAM